MILFTIVSLGFGCNVMVWFSFRCTGGSQLQTINIAKGTNRTKDTLNDHHWVFIESFQVATPITRAVRARGAMSHSSCPEATRTRKKLQSKLG